MNRKVNYISLDKTLENLKLFTRPNCIINNAWSGSEKMKWKINNGF